MNRIMTGLSILLVLTLALAPASVFASEKKATAPGTELYVHKSPDFLVTVPKNWSKSDKSKNPNCLLRKAYDPFEVTTFEIAVADQGDEAKEDISDNRMDWLEENWGATNMEVLYERDTKLKDGTPAYELELKWQHPAILLYTYYLFVYKDKKEILVTVTTDAKVSDALKAIPRSLTLE
ncbi:MAG: hypothetical protein JRJ85_11925 [Deltaproteobacteria bacterium]|nr:hypothetical protein [Deltaproteobacteria bacterium]